MSGAPPPPPPLRFYSIVLAVADIAAMRDWYGRVLGMAVRLAGSSDGGDFAVLEGAGTCIELVSRPGITRQPSPLPDPPDHLGRAGWNILDLETDDLVALDQHLRGQGVAPLWSMHAISPRRAVTMFRDPEGNMIAVFGVPPA